jgi:hypothetical protein
MCSSSMHITLCTLCLELIGATPCPLAQTEVMHLPSVSLFNVLLCAVSRL